MNPVALRKCDMNMRLKRRDVQLHNVRENERRSGTDPGNVHIDVHS